jgi:hypothetical protein
VRDMALEDAPVAPQPAWPVRASLSGSGPTV